MAYQNVGTPRFYINVLEWLESLGVTAVDREATNIPWETIPSDFEFRAEQRNLTINPTAAEILDILFINSKLFVAMLGHGDAGRFSRNGELPSFNNGVNISFEGLNHLFVYDGFTIARMEDTGREPYDDDYNVLTITPPGGDIWTPCYIGNCIMGSYYDMPHSPNLSLTMTRELDGVDRVRTLGGSDLVDHKYIKSKEWGGLAPWELGAWGSDTSASRIGRRSWDLSFDYISKEDAFPKYTSLSLLETGEDDLNNPEQYITPGSNDFYSQVIYRTNGGQLPFIFQPDKDNDNPDQFAICKIAQDSIQYSQVANTVYNIKLKIIEIW